MSIIVQKFGGTSVADINHIRNVAKKVEAELKKGSKVAVVVSAMAGVTDQLVEWSRQAANKKNKDFFTDEELAEYDAIISSGEQVTSGLLALALLSNGIRSKSYLGWQLPFRTKGSHSNAKIENVNISLLEQDFAEGIVPIVAGFQGVNEKNRIMTLGRGGSDISAVALSVKLNAERCDIYTDVDGVYTTDPRITVNASKINKISYEEMLEMSALGAKVVHERAVEMAMKHNMPLKVLSSFSENDGTLITYNDEDLLSQNPVTGIACKENEAIVTLTGLLDKPGVISNIFSLLADEEIITDTIVQTASKDNIHVEISFTIPKMQIKKAHNLLENNKNVIKYENILIEEEISKISVIGLGIKTNGQKNNSVVAMEIFKILAKNSINIKVISTSEMRISLVIDAIHMKRAVESLHAVFGLDRINALATEEV